MGVLLLLSRQVESQQPHFLSIPPPLRSHLCAPGFVLLSLLNFTTPQPPALLSVPLPTLFLAVLAAPKTWVDRGDHYCHREHGEHKGLKDSSHAPVRCLSFAFHSLLSFCIPLKSNQHNPDKSIDAMARETLQTSSILSFVGVCVCG